VAQQGAVCPGGPVQNRWQLHGGDYIFNLLARPRNKSTTRARSSGVDDQISKYGVSKKKKRSCVVAAQCTPASVGIGKISPNLLFCLQKKEKKKRKRVFGAYIGLDTANNCCCTADVYRARLVYLHA